MNLGGAAIVSLSAMILAGCETFYGIGRTTNFTQPINWDCVGDAVEAAVIDGNVARNQRESVSFGIVPRWGTITTTSNMVFYEVPHLPGVIIQSLTDDDEQDVSWSHSYYLINQPVSEATVDNLRPVMLIVEDAVAVRCGMDFRDTVETVKTSERGLK